MPTTNLPGSSSKELLGEVWKDNQVNSWKYWQKFLVFLQNGKTDGKAV